jgi:hypothetical protein
MRQNDKRRQDRERFKAVKESRNPPRGKYFLIPQNLALENKIDKKILILILHNLACCYQKSKEYDSCVDYLEAVIYNYDGLLESKHKIKVGLEYFKNINNASLSKDKTLGDIILQVRFSAKFHLQMCAVLSQANNHDEAIRHAQIAAYMCEDNISKTYYLFYQIKDEISKKMNSDPEGKEFNELARLDDQLNQMKKVINNLHKQITDIQAYKKKGLKKGFE